MESKSDLLRQGAYYVHHISTPLATLQLNLQVLAKFLPVLVDHYRRTGDDGTAPPAIPPETLAALQNLTVPMQDSVTVIQQRTQIFAEQLQLHHPRKMSAQSSDNTDTARRIQKVLVIEDEDIHQAVVVKQLGAFCQVDLAADGSEAIEKWRAQTYDLILMDFVLPGMSGPQILQTIAEVGGPTPIVLGFTNLPEAPDEYSRTAIPISAYLSKPFTLANFEALLARLNLSLEGGTRP